MKKTLKNKKGFTLIELLAVIIILAVIMIITIPTILGSMNKAKQKTINNVSSIIGDYLSKQYESCKFGNKTIMKYDENLFKEGSDCYFNIESGNENSKKDFAKKIIENTGYAEEIKEICIQVNKITEGSNTYYSLKNDGNIAIKGSDNGSLNNLTSDNYDNICNNTETQTESTIIIENLTNDEVNIEETITTNNINEVTNNIKTLILNEYEKCNNNEEYDQNLVFKSYTSDGSNTVCNLQLVQYYTNYSQFETTHLDAYFDYLIEKFNYQNDIDEIYFKINKQTKIYINEQGHTFSMLDDSSKSAILYTLPSDLNDFKVYVIGKSGGKYGNNISDEFTEDIKTSSNYVKLKNYTDQ